MQTLDPDGVVCGATDGRAWEPGPLGMTGIDQLRAQDSPIRLTKLRGHGTIFVISHDRYFLDKIVDRILELEDGQLTEYLGDYTYYRERKRSQQAGFVT